jgi:molybdopterin/thiamine biosynthesis adenylyltransferase
MTPLINVESFRKYYGRQILLKDLGEKGQENLARSKVAIVGMGGLGTASSLYLALAGVGCLRVIDQDTVDFENLHRQVLYRPEDVDYPKVEIAEKRLRGKNPLVKIEPVPENLNSQNVERLLRGVDCVVDGLDNFHTRYLVNRACAKLATPYIFGAAIGIEGNLSVFSPPDTPCLECVFPNIQDNMMSTCEVVGVLSPTPGIIGAMQAMETVKVLAGLGEPLKNKLMICDFNDMYFGTIDIFRRSDCKACGRAKGQKQMEEKVAWLCGRNTANVNPRRKWNKSLEEILEAVSRNFKIKVKSSLAIIFHYKTFEISLFSGGRMLIKGVKDEKMALNIYKEIAHALGVS